MCGALAAHRLPPILALPEIRNCELPPTYVRLSAAYDEDAARARERGFPVGVFEGAHLDTVSRPGEVAEVVDRVVRELVGE